LFCEHHFHILRVVVDLSPLDKQVFGNLLFLFSFGSNNIFAFIR